VTPDLGNAETAETGVSSVNPGGRLKTHLATEANARATERAVNVDPDELFTNAPPPRSRSRRRKPTEAELANERRVFDELAELMVEGVLVDRSELVPPLAEERPAGPQPQASLVEQLPLSLDEGEGWQACAACSWHWSLSCWRSGCWEAERVKT